MLVPISHRPKPKPFCVYDIETTTDLKRVYLVGHYDGNGFKYFESPPLPPEDPSSAMTQYLNWRFNHPTKAYIYAHNGGNFDAVFALASIIRNRPGLHLEIIPSQSSILMLKVKEYAKSKRVWTFLDSARLLPDKLENLGQCFLNRGKVKEGIDYETLHTNPLRYDYLRTDCVLLYDVLSAYFSLLYDTICGAAGISAASTALATYRTAHQKTILPDISEKAATLSRHGYYGGRCEPFRRCFDSRHAESNNQTVLNCYDINSMYPWAMKQPQPVEELDIKGYHPELTGFVDATVTIRKCHIPILPCRADNRLLFPVGTWRGVFSTCELRQAEEEQQIYYLKSHDAVYFRTDHIFDSYVDSLYKYRQKSCGSRPGLDHSKCSEECCSHWSFPLDRVAKISLNSLYGKFGSQEIRESIHISPTLDEVIKRGMEPLPSPLGIDVYIERTTRQAGYMLPQIAAWITALARVRLVQGLLTNPQAVHYCDTDSIFTNARLRTGSDLGQWKDEYRGDQIIYAYFLSPKVYVLIHSSGKVTNKAKGFSRFGKTLPQDVIELLSKGESIEVSRFAKVRSVIRGDFGLIFAQKKCHMNYTKRIFHDDGTSEPRSVTDGHCD